MLRIKVLCLETSQKQRIGGDRKIPTEVKNGAKIIKRLYTGLYIKKSLYTSQEGKRWS